MKQTRKFLPITVLTVATALVAASPAPADFMTGLAAFDAGDYQTARQQWQTSADRGEVAAQLALANLFATGAGVPHDERQAAYWYQQAADLGSADGQLNLGDRYARGLGVPRNLEQAYVWLSLAAEQGRAWARDRRGDIAAAMSKAELKRAKLRLAYRGVAAD